MALAAAVLIALVVGLGLSAFWIFTLAYIVRTKSDLNALSPRQNWVWGNRHFVVRLGQIISGTAIVILVIAVIDLFTGLACGTTTECAANGHNGIMFRSPQETRGPIISSICLLMIYGIPLKIILMSKRSRSQLWESPSLPISTTYYELRKRLASLTNG